MSAVIIFPVIARQTAGVALGAQRRLAAAEANVVILPVIRIERGAGSFNPAPSVAARGRRGAGPPSAGAASVAGAET